MTGELRSLSFVVELLDRATKPLQAIVGTAEKLDRSTVQLGIEVDGADEAEGSFERLQDGLEKLNDIGQEMGEQLQGAGEKVATAGQKIKEVWDPASQSFIQVAVAANQAGQKIQEVTAKMGPLENAARKVSSAIDDAKTKLLGIQVAAGAFMYSSISAAAEVERLENTVKAGFGEGADAILKWAEAGGKLTGVTNESRMAMALLFQQTKMSNEQIMTSTELVEKYWKNKNLRGKLQTAGIGSKEALAEQIKNVETGGGRAFALKQVWGKDALEDVIQNGRGAKKVLSLMRKDLEKTADTSDDTLSAQADLGEAWGEFTEEAGKGLLGPMTTIFKLLTGVIQLIQSIPGGAAVAGLGAGLTFVAVSLVFLIGMLANAIISITTLIGAERLAALQSKAWAAAQYLAAGASGVLSGAVGVLTGALQVMKAAMLSNPLTAAFVILLGVLILLETKFHIFSNLFKSLEKVDWAGKWASSVEYLTGLWDGLIDGVSWVKGLVSGGLGALSKLGGGNIALGGLTVAMPGIGIMVGLLKSLLELGFGSFIKIKDIYDEVRNSFSRALGHLGIVSDWLNTIFDFLDNSWKTVSEFYIWLKGIFVKSINYIINGINSLITGINALLTAFKIGFQIPLIELIKDEKETKDKDGKEVVESDAARHKRILEENLQAYNIDQAAGGQLGTPAVGAGEVPGYQPAFGGEFAGYNFESSRYPGLTRTGKELTEEQMMSGEWTPKNTVDEFGGFAGELSQAQIDAFNAKIAAAKIDAAKIEIKADNVNVEEKKSSSSGTIPKVGALNAQALVDDLTGNIPEADLSGVKGETHEEKVAQAKANIEESGKKELSNVPGYNAIAGLFGGGVAQSSSSSESGKSSSSSESKKEPSSAPKGTPTGEKVGSTNIVSGGSSGSGGMKAPDTFEAPSSDFESPTFDSGGRVGKTGKATVHEGEEVISEEDKAAVKIGIIPSVLQGIDAISTRLRAAESTPTAAPVAAAPPTVIREGDKTVNMYGPFVSVGKIDNRIDLDRMQTDLIKFLRGEIKSAMKG